MSSASLLYERRSPRMRAAHRRAPGGSRRSGRAGEDESRRRLELGKALGSTGPLVLFLLATAFVVLGVWLLTLVPTLWVLVLVMAMHAIATVLVMMGIAVLLGED